LDCATKHITDVLKGVKNPIVWVGSDVSRFGVREDFIKWMARAGINFVTSIASKSVIDERNERFVGVFAGKSSNKHVVDALRQAASIFVIGETISENDTIGQSMNDLMNSRRVIFINHSSVVETGRFVASPVYIREFVTKITENETRFNTKIISQGSTTDTQNPTQLTYDGIVTMFSQSPLMNGSTISCDQTLGLISCVNMTCRQDSFIGAAGNYSYGSALATAVGQHFGTTKRPIIFLGDGALAASGTTIGTLQKVRSNAIVVVFNNGLLGITQWNSNPRVYSSPKDPVDPFNVPTRVGISKFAESMDAVAFSCESFKELTDVIKRVEGADRVTVIDCKIPQKNIPTNCQWRVPSQ